METSTQIIADVDWREIEAFLVLAEELHFGRAAERLHVTTARVSQLIRGFEQRIGEALFTRTSRKVIPTPLGRSLLVELAPAYRRIATAIANAQQQARISTATLRVAYIISVGMARVHGYVSEFERVRPGALVSTKVLNVGGRFAAPVRDNSVDLLLLWLPEHPRRIAEHEPDLEFSPPLVSHPRALAVGLDHPLAARASVHAEELAEYELYQPPDWLPEWYVDAWAPPETPAGQPIRRRTAAPEWSLDVVFDAVARTGLAHLTVADLTASVSLQGIALIPVVGLPPLHLTAVWHTDHTAPLLGTFLDAAQRVGRRAMRRAG
ncbi:LysR family transcriptional regulator [Nocardia terpenica]|uniref:LysR family transcriptional regulator n=1 Tax=Nocardia terpenica TaxID=455432 RepID=A0A6G9ZCP4_9NOCA|nr:LysR family transcriptional regulator [Nocardia terpenica]QIS23200.1 LysR family transcriptional regulator [Nocardia terpenica]